MPIQLHRKQQRLNTMRSKQEVEQPALHILGVLESSGASGQEIIVERGAGSEDFAARREEHDKGDDGDGAAVRAAGKGEGGDLGGLRGGHSGGA